jgi:hypothetical protein
MSDSTDRTSIVAAMDGINCAWLDRRPADIGPRLHPDVTMVFPGFGGRTTGRDALVAGFADFCMNASVHEYREGDRHVDVAGDTAVVSFPYEMVYERDAAKYRCAGRDLWVFARSGGEWLAVWRTMLDLTEQPA